MFVDLDPLQAGERRLRPLRVGSLLIATTGAHARVPAGTGHPGTRRRRRVRGAAAPHRQPQDDARQVAERITYSIALPFQIGVSHQIDISASIGILYLSEHAGDEVSPDKCADYRPCTRRKDAGRDRLFFCRRGLARRRGRSRVQTGSENSPGVVASTRTRLRCPSGRMSAIIWSG